MKKLLIFGDSHSVIWEGNNVLSRGKNSRFPCVECHHLGPALAFNLMNESGESVGKWGRKILEILQELDENEMPSGIILCFGEIDIRTNLIKLSVKNNTTIQDEVSIISMRVLEFSKILFRKFSIPIFIWEPIATMTSKSYTINPEFPTVGSELERNYATFLMSKTLRSESTICKKNGYSIFPFGIFDKITNNMRTKPCYYEDYVHLNLYGLDLAIESLREVCEKNNLSHFRCFDDFMYFHDFMPTKKNRIKYLLRKIKSIIKYDNR